MIETYNEAINSIYAGLVYLDDNVNSTRGGSALWDIKLTISNMRVLMTALDLMLKKLCPVCGGGGTRHDALCERCDGTGFIGKD